MEFKAAKIIRYIANAAMLVSLDFLTETINEGTWKFDELTTSLCIIIVRTNRRMAR